MAIHGDLTTVHLPDILQLLVNSQNTGVLRLLQGKKLVRVFFRKGALLMASSSAGKLHLGFFLDSRGIDPAALATASAVASSGKQELMEVLLESEVISADSLRKMIRDLSAEIIYDLFLWSSGSFVFEEGEPDLPEFLREAEGFNIFPLIMEGVRRIDEWQRIKTYIPDAGIIYDVSPKETVDAHDLSHDEMEVLSLVNGQRSVAEICLKRKSSDFDTMIQLFTLASTGLIINVGSKELPPDYLAVDGPAPTLLADRDLPPIPGKRRTVIVTVIACFAVVALIWLGMRVMRSTERQGVVPGDSLIDGVSARPSTTVPAGVRVPSGEAAVKVTSGTQSMEGNSKVNINTAGADELMTLPRIGPKIADRIIRYRQDHGPFKNPEDLQEVSGIGPKTYEGLQNLITTK